MLTNKEIQVFREITLNGPQIASEFTEVIRTSESYLSTILQKMTKKGLVKRTRNGKNKILQIAETAHASILQNMILNNPRSKLEYITNKGIKILATLTCQNICTIEELREASNTSNMTLWKFMNKAREIGLIQNKEPITISPRYEQVTEFVRAYTKYIHETKARKYADDALIKWSCSEDYLFETHETLNLQHTGISAFQDYGALFLTSKNLYTNSKETLSLEDHLINHISSEGKENTLPLLITWRLNREKIDPTYIKNKAYRYRISEITDAVQRYLDSKGKEKQDYLINWTEFNNKYREYSDE
jgi:DNA-binding MarR family transcriptional regulator